MSNANDNDSEVYLGTPPFKVEIVLAYRCPFCRELPYLSHGHKARIGDNRVVRCMTIGCAIYKVSIVLRIWNSRYIYLVKVGSSQSEWKENIYDRSNDKSQHD